MISGPSGGRQQQRLRTRKDLLAAASRLMQQGRRPSLDEVAEAAMVSRATAYRYFPDADSLLHEAALDVTAPQVDEVLGKAPADALARVERVDDAFHEMVLANEAALRVMLANSLQRAATATDGADLPARQNRRTPLIEAALEPHRREFSPAALRSLVPALAILIGPEAMIVCRDVLRLDDASARRVKRWAIRALVEAAKRQT